MRWRYLTLLMLFALASCEMASGLVFHPEPTDSLDGYEGSLAQAGINTDMDWGPKQNLLLSEYKTLKESHRQLKKEQEQLLASNQNLQSQLSGEKASLQTELGKRAQAEAETEQLRQRIRDYEARILSLSIEKAKLEQARLRSQITALNNTLNSIETSTANATAKTGR
jgi:chromosome segregation ATPase